MGKYQTMYGKWILEISAPMAVVFAVYAVSIYASAISAAERSGPHADASLFSFEMMLIEEHISIAQDDELNLIELKIARILQNNPNDLSANYLMSTLLLKMFTLDPGSYSLIRQSTELASQTYDLDPKSELGIAALASILEVTGEAERGLALIKEAGATGLRLGWHTNLVKARLLTEVTHAGGLDEVLSVLGDVLTDSNASRKLVAPILADVIRMKYEKRHGLDEIDALETWSKLCPSIEMTLELANANAQNLNYKKAYAEYEKILLKVPTHTESLISQGIIAQASLHNLTLAIHKFKAAIATTTNPAFEGPAKIHLALALIEQNTNLEASKLASLDAIKSSRDQEKILLAILAAYRRTSTATATLALLKDLEQSVPGLALGHALMAEMLAEGLHLFDEATTSFTNAITLDPSRSEYYNGRGLAWMGLANLEAALDDFEAAAAVNPDDASARYNTACAQARLGRQDDALASLRQSFELDFRLQTLAKSDEDLLSMRSEPRFEALVNLDLRSGKEPLNVGH